MKVYLQVVISEKTNTMKIKMHIAVERVKNVLKQKLPEEANRNKEDIFKRMVKVYKSS